MSTPNGISFHPMALARCNSVTYRHRLTEQSCTVTSDTKDDTETFLDKHIKHTYHLTQQSQKCQIHTVSGIPQCLHTDTQFTTKPIFSYNKRVTGTILHTTDTKTTTIIMMILSIIISIVIIGSVEKSESKLKHLLFHLLPY